MNDQEETSRAVVKASRDVDFGTEDVEFNVPVWDILVEMTGSHLEIQLSGG